MDLRIAVESVVRAASPEPEHNDSYPWAAYTPEISPRGWDETHNMECSLPEVPSQPMLSPELLRTVFAPHFEQMCCSVQNDAFVQKMPAEMITPDVLQPMCEPFFEQMVVALQQSMQQHSSHQTQGQHFNIAQSMQTTGLPAFDACFQPVFFPSQMFYHMDDASTEADDSCPFTSNLSPSSEGEVDAAEGKSEDTSDVERTAMVCRHWKSKGWCRLESKCKFLHPEHKRGVSAHGVCLGDDCTESGRRKKKSSKKRGTREQTEQHTPEGQEVAGL